MLSAVTKNPSHLGSGTPVEKRNMKVIHLSFIISTKDNKLSPALHNFHHADGLTRVSSEDHLGYTCSTEF